MGWITTTLSSTRSLRYAVTYTDTTYLGVGTHNQRIMYASNDPLRGIIFVRPGINDGSYSDLIFGHSGVEYPFCT